MAVTWRELFEVVGKGEGREEGSMRNLTLDDRNYG